MRVDVKEPYVLAPGVRFVEVSSLPESTRTIIGQSDDKLAVYLPYSRSAVRLVDRSLATLLGAFAAPTRLSDAITAFARDAGGEPVAVAERAYPFLRECILAHLLTPVRPDAADQPISYSLAPGDIAHGMLVKRRIRLLRDTEVYELVSPGDARVVLKTSRPQSRDDKRLHFRREAEVLARLPRGIGPAPIHDGSAEDVPFIVMEHLDGISIAERAMFSRRKGRAGLAGLLGLCRNVAAAYAALSAAGVLHGDVHPGNLLATADGAVRLLDFGLARITADVAVADRGERGGVTYYMEPEWAVESLAGRPPPALTEAAQVYALAYLLYELLSGRQPYERKLVMDDVLTQIATAPAAELPAVAGVRSGDLVAVLARGLAKSPAQRYPTVAAFAAAFDRAAAAIDAGVVRAGGTLEQRQAAWVDWLLARAWREADDPAPMRSRPSSSVMNGAAGVALALHRVACATDDGEIVSLAQRWVSKARRDLATGEALYFDTLTPELIGRSTPYHTASGIDFAGAVLASEQQDWPSFTEFAARYTDAALLPCDNPDLTLGKAGALLGLSLLVEQAGPGAPGCRDALVPAGQTLARELHDWIAARGPVGRDPAFDYLGVAHGLPGILYALVGSPFASAEMLEAADARLSEIAARAEPAGEGVRWSRMLLDDAQASYFPSWCNGNGGQVHFWLEMARRFGKDRYRDLAIRSGWNCWDDPAAGPTLCCGLGGQAYAFLALHGATGEEHWLGKAQTWAELAAAPEPGADRPLDALYKGMTGVAALLADMKRPDLARMPLFGLAGQAAATGA